MKSTKSDNNSEAELAQVKKELQDANDTIKALLNKDQAEVDSRQKAESAFRQSEQKFRVIFEDAPLGIFRSTPEGRFVEVNPALARMLGYDSPEDVLREIYDIAKQIYVRTEDRQPIVSEQLKSLKMTQHVNRYRRADGTEFIANLYLNSICDEAGKTIYLEGIVEDITERQAAEDQNIQLNLELEQRVLERTRELEAFTYSVAHDLRAPLRAIDGFSKILIEDYGDKVDAEGNRVINIIRKNVHKMDQLIVGLSALSRISNTELNQLDIDMYQLVKSTLKDAAAVDVRLQFDVVIHPLSVAWGDPALIRQVWFNLIDNAIKYTMKSESKKIEIGGYTENEENIYYIKDSGVGFNPNYSHNLFGLFQRLHSPADFAGTGVGLAIVQRIIQRHKGRIWAESVENTGATFYFSLPKIRRY